MHHGRARFLLREAGTNGKVHHNTSRCGLDGHLRNQQPNVNEICSPPCKCIHGVQDRLASRSRLLPENALPVHNFINKERKTAGSLYEISVPLHTLARCMQIVYTQHASANSEPAPISLISSPNHSGRFGCSCLKRLSASPQVNESIFGKYARLC